MVTPMASSTMPAALELAFGSKAGTTRGCVATGSGMVSIGAPMPAAGNACCGCIIIHAVGNGIGAISPNGAGGGIIGAENIGGDGMTGGAGTTGTSAAAASAGDLGDAWVGPATGGWSAVGGPRPNLPCRPTLAAARGVQFLYSRVAAHLR